MSRVPPRIFLFLSVVSLLPWIARDVAADSRPVILMVNVAADSRTAARETRFFNELRLNLDRFAVEQISPTSSNFMDLSLSRQIDSLRPRMTDSGALAVMWLDQVSPDVLLLQVVVLSTGRALVRLFEQNLMEGSETELARNAAELLGTAFMFEMEQGNRAVAQVVEDTRQKVLAADDRGNRWKFFVAWVMRQGLVGLTGPGFSGGGALGAEFRATQRLHFSPGVGAGFGPLGESKGYDVKGWNVWAQWTGFIAFTAGKVLLGPEFGLRGGSSGISVSREGFSGQNFQGWFLSGLLGAGLRVPFSQKMSLSISTGVEATPGQHEIKSLSDDALIYASPFMAWWASVGLVLF